MRARSSPHGSYYELNYLISEATALLVRDFLGTYLDCDEYSVGGPDFGYPVYTLYLDSDDLTLYRQAINDIEHRCQLRVRYWSSQPEAPVRLEIKRRLADAVIKERCLVRPEAVALLLAGELVPFEFLAARSAGHLEVVHHFLTRTQRLGARPKLRLGFLRECYLSDDETVRVTMDRLIQCEPCFAPELGTEFEHPHRLFPAEVLLELSYAERFPHWFRELVECFSLLPCEADKFVAAVSAWGGRALSPSASAIMPT